MITEQTHFKTDLKTLIMIIAAIAIAVWTYSEINNRLTKLETSEQLMKQDLLEASKQLPIDQEQFMLLEHISLQVEKLTIRVDDMMHNKVMIGSIDKDLDKALNDIEKLKDSVRANIGKLNGDH
nr:Fibrinogen-like coiled coil protein [uncultured Mediterranean phage uvMED]|tara:strand:- start:83 stop:454 length:372 start_codon:yes stop_codon:yes gene_type:complete